MIRWYELADDLACQRLYLICHPGAEPRHGDFYRVFPTLVAIERHQVVGMTTWTIAFSPSGTLVAYGMDVAVHPDDRAHGLGTALQAERCRISRAVGAVDFVGTTTEANTAMRTIFERQGLKRFDEGGHAIYIGPLA